MAEPSPQLNVVVLENRQMIATILSELLTGAGYNAQIVAQLAEVAELLPECQPGMLLVDLGMIRPDMRSQWQQLQEQVVALGLPILTFSCSPAADLTEEVLVLRSPGDFAMVVEWIEAEWRKKQPYLGARLIERGLVGGTDVEAVLRVQRELARIGRSYPLGELLVRLGFLTAQDLAQALESANDPDAA